MTENPRERLLQHLDEKNIPYELVEHGVYLTVEDANGDRDWPGIGLKNLFVKDKKTEKYYLLILEENRRMDTKALAELLGWHHNKIRFAEEEDLMAKLGLARGAGSVFGILNNEDNDVTVLLDKALTIARDDDITHFPANVNNATLIITVGALRKFLAGMENTIVWEPAEAPEDFSDKAVETAVSDKELPVYELLADLEIPYTLYRHEPAFTTEEFAQLGIPLPGLHVKNLFVRDTKDDAHYLVLLPWGERLNVKGYRESVGWSRRSLFCEEEELMDILGVTHGSCSVFSMLNDTEKKVILVVGHTIAAASCDTMVSFHPNDNRATVILSYGDLKKCIEAMDCRVVYVA